jgi:hypothetical protein
MPVLFLYGFFQPLENISWKNLVSKVLGLSVQNIYELSKLNSVKFGK